MASAPRKCAYCHRQARHLCDYPIDSVTGKTCDKPLCEEHRVQVGSSFLCRRGRGKGCHFDTIDRCPGHAGMPDPPSGRKEDTPVLYVTLDRAALRALLSGDVVRVSGRGGSVQMVVSSELRIALGDPAARAAILAPLQPASKDNVVPCPRCGAGWPIVQAFWARIEGARQLICCCTQCGIEGTIKERGTCDEPRDPT